MFIQSVRRERLRMSLATLISLVLADGPIRTFVFRFRSDLFLPQGRLTHTCWKEGETPFNGS